MASQSVTDAVVVAVSAWSVFGCEECNYHHYFECRRHPHLSFLNLRQHLIESFVQSRLYWLNELRHRQEIMRKKLYCKDYSSHHKQLIFLQGVVLRKAP